jgi:hypothetical protein
MGFTSCTVFFEGSFWIALVERSEQAGASSVARHVFGPEPSNPELLHFYLFVLPTLRFLSGRSPQKKEKRKPRSAVRSRPKKALDAFKQLRAADAKERRKTVSRERTEEVRLRYLQKVSIRKLKRKGK